MNPCSPKNEGFPYLVTSTDGAIIFDPKHNRFLRLNTVATEMWLKLRTGMGNNDLAAYIAKRYGIEEKIASHDIEVFIRKMSSHGFEINCVLAANETTIFTPSEKVQQSAFPWYAHRDSSHVRPPFLSIVSAIMGLLAFDFILSRQSFDALCSRIRSWPVKTVCPRDHALAIQKECAAINRACIWYPKKTLCLQRSAVTTCLLRNRGIDARMVLGIQPTPLAAHAWVEVEGAIVNDFGQVRQCYQTFASL
jgi:hypothetical protein